MPQVEKIAVTLTADNRQLRTQMRQATRDVRTFERQVTSMGQRMRNVRMRLAQTGVLGRGGGMLRTAAGFAGVSGLGMMIKEARDFNAIVTDISITGNLGAKSTEALRKSIMSVSQATARSTFEVAEFVSTVTTLTGDAEGAKVALADMGEIAVATGANMGDLAGVFVKLTQNLGIMPSKARAAFNVLRAQETKGAITVQGMAQHFGKVAGAGIVLGEEGKGIKGATNLGALFQLAGRIKGRGQEGEAASAVAAFIRFAVQKEKEVKKRFGVSIRDKSGNIRDMPTYLEELGLALNKDKKKAGKYGTVVFGRAGITVAQALMDATRTGKFDPNAGFMFRDAGKTDVLKGHAAKRRQSLAWQFDKAMNDMKVSLQKHMLPILKSAVKVLPKFASALGFALKHSETLFKLWLGWKGAQFFKRLMAPVGGTGGMVGGAPYSAAAVSAMRGAGLPVAPSVTAARSGTFLNPVMSQTTRGFGFNRLSDAEMLRREQSRARRFGGGVRRMGSFAYRNMGATAPLAGMAAMAGATNRSGSKLETGFNLAAGAAVMSGNPIAMLVGGGLLLSKEGVVYFESKGLFGESFKSKGEAHDMRRASSLLARGRVATEHAEFTMRKFLAGELSGEHTAGTRINKAMKAAFGEAGEDVTLKNVMGEDIAGFQLDLGKIMGPAKTKKKQMAALEAAKSRFTGIHSALRDRTVEAIQRRRKKAGLKRLSQEEMNIEVEKAMPVLKELSGSINALDKAIARIEKGLKVNAIVRLPKGLTPGERLPERVQSGGHVTEGFVDDIVNRLRGHVR